MLITGARSVSLALVENGEKARNKREMGNRVKSERTGKREKMNKNKFRMRGRSINEAE